MMQQENQLQEQQIRNQAMLLQQKQQLAQLVQPSPMHAPSTPAFMHQLPPPQPQLVTSFNQQYQQPYPVHSAPMQMQPMQANSMHMQQQVQPASMQMQPSPMQFMSPNNQMRPPTQMGPNQPGQWPSAQY